MSYINHEVVSTTNEISNYLNSLPITDETKVLSLVGMLSEFVVLHEGETHLDDRLDLIISLLKNTTNRYNGLLEQ